MFIIVIILSLLLLGFFKTDLLTHTKYYVGGEANSSKAVSILESGQYFMVFDKSDNCDIQHVVDEIYDNPNLFWLKPMYRKLSIGDWEVLIMFPKPDVEVAKSEIEYVSDLVISSIIKNDMSEYDKVLAIHDWICKNVDYERSDDWSDQDAYGAIVNGKALCAGYAEGFSYLLNKAGIENRVISGEASENGKDIEPHAWNLVYVNQKPYYFDITWDDTLEGVSYDWFGLTKEAFEKAHFPSVGYEWEEAVYRDACYYAKKGMLIESCSTSVIASQISQQGRTFSVMCANWNIYEQLTNMLNNKDKILEIMKICNISTVNGISYSDSPNSLCLTVTLR